MMSDNRNVSLWPEISSVIVSMTHTRANHTTYVLTIYHPTTQYMINEKHLLPPSDKKVIIGILKQINKKVK